VHDSDTDSITKKDVIEANSKATRAIVCSDIHGRPHVLEAIVRHSGFNRGGERLIIAGDLNDDRDGDGEVLALAESLGAEIVLGNHELWHIDGYRDYDGIVFRSNLVLEKMLTGAWVMAIEVDGVLITHAGVSQFYAERWDLDGLAAAEIARRLNSQARLVGLRFINDEPSGDEAELLEGHGPAWYYPDPMRWPLTSIPQITGHRVPGYQVDWPMIALYEEDRFYHIDPGVRVHEYENDERTHIRYAVIEAGEVTIVDEFV